MSLSSSRMLVIGCGNMGAAVINGIVEKYPGIDIVAVDPAVDRARSLLKHPDRVALRRLDGERWRERFDIVILAIKPQIWNQSAEELAPLVEDALVVSIMAGITTETLKKRMRTERAVRAMPNLAAEIGCSMTVGFADGDTADRSLAASVLACIGRIEWLPAEADIDKATAISGSGPGYVFAFAEDLVQAAIAEGLSAEVADTLVRHTLLGSAKLLASTPRSPTSLKEAVTSPKGTTEAGLSVLGHENALTRLISQTVKAAHMRARELGGQEGVSLRRDVPN